MQASRETALSAQSYPTGKAWIAGDICGYSICFPGGHSIAVGQDHTSHIFPLHLVQPSRYYDRWLHLRHTLHRKLILYSISSRMLYNFHLSQILRFLFFPEKVLQNGRRTNIPQGFHAHSYPRRPDNKNNPRPIPAKSGQGPMKHDTDNPHTANTVSSDF